MSAHHKKIKNLLTSTEQSAIIKPRGEGNTANTKPKQDKRKDDV